MFVIAIADKQLAHMPNSTCGLSNPQNEVVIAAVPEVFVPIKAQPIVNLLFHEKSLMEHIAEPDEAQDIVIVECLLAPENLTSGAIDIDDIAEQSLPIQILL